MGNTDAKHRSGGDSGSSDTLPILETRVSMRGAPCAPGERSHPPYEPLRRHTLSSHIHGHSPAPPPRPTKSMERSQSLLEKQRASPLHEPRRSMASLDAHATDTMKAHLVHVEPKEGSVGVEMGSTIVVQFDGDVKTVNEDKIVEVRGSVHFESKRLMAIFEIQLFHSAHDNGWRDAIMLSGPGCFLQPC